MQTQKGIESLQVPCLVYKGDMGDVACCEELLLKIRKVFGGVNVLVNNAGISHIGLLQDVSMESWEYTLRMNLTFAFNCCELAVPYMISQRQGKIVNISSVWGVVDASCEAACPATRGDINTLTRTLAEELAPSNIWINAITCGVTDTEMNQWMGKDDLIVLVDKIPLGHLGRVEEMTDLVYHLGHKKSYLIEQVIRLGGGWTQTGEFKPGN